MRTGTELDERQELILLRIESRGYRIMYWGLLAAIIVQEWMGLDGSNWMGECLVLLPACVYVGVRSAREGIWHRRLRPDRRTNVLLSLLAAVLVGVPMFGMTFWRYHRAVGSLAAAVFVAVPTFLLVYALLAAFARYTMRRRRALETEPEEDP